MARAHGQTHHLHQMRKMAIPPLTTLTPAIFVPIPAAFPRDLPGPAASSSPDADKLRSSLLAIDQHANSVKGNILALSRRECTRLVLEGKAFAAQQENSQHTNIRRAGLTPASRAAMLANMMAPAATDPAPEQLPLPDFAAMQVDNPADWTRREVMVTVAKTLVEVTGFERHVGKLKGPYEGALRQEEMRYQRKRSFDGEPKVDGV